jgi:hypothetical protein
MRSAYNLFLIRIQSGWSVPEMGIRFYLPGYKGVKNCRHHQVKRVVLLEQPFLINA